MFMLKWTLGPVARIGPCIVRFVTAAEAAGIKLVVPMIGNWGPWISLYIQQILGTSATHDRFTAMRISLQHTRNMSISLLIGTRAPVRSLRGNS